MTNALRTTLLFTARGSQTFGEALAVSDDRVCITGQGSLPSSFPLVLSTGAANFIACADSSGSPLWATRLAAANMILTDIALDASNRIYVTGYFYEKVDLGGSISATTADDQPQQVIMSFEADGKPRWLRTLPGLDAWVIPRVLVLDDDRIAYTGQIAGAIEFAGLAIDDPFAGASDGDTMAALLVELDSDGNAQWATTYVIPENDAAFASITQAPDDGIVLTTRDSIFFEGVHLYDRSGERIASYRATMHGSTYSEGAPFVASRAGGFVVGARCSPLGPGTGACLFELDENLEAKSVHYFVPFDDSNTTIGLAVGAQNAVFMVIENDLEAALDLRRIIAP